MMAWRLCQKIRIDHNLMGRDKNISIDLCAGTIYIVCYNKMNVVFIIKSK